MGIAVLPSLSKIVTLASSSTISILSSPVFRSFPMNTSLSSTILSSLTVTVTVVTNEPSANIIGTFMTPI